MRRSPLSLAGQRALVTGGSSGLGRAVAQGLHREGARTAVVDLADPGGLPPEDRWIRADVRAPAEPVVQQALQQLGGLDLLVLNAGIARDRVLWKLADPDWEEVLDLNAGHCFRYLRAAVPHLRAQGYGKVVIVGSINGLRGRFGQAAYSASKAACMALARTAARELGAFGINVNAVAPGMIRTPMVERLPDELRERSRLETALGRLGEPDEVAEVVLFLLSDRARHMTGSIVVVDGGQTA